MEASGYIYLYVQKCTTFGGKCLIAAKHPSKGNVEWEHLDHASVTRFFLHLKARAMARITANMLYIPTIDFHERFDVWQKESHHRAEG